MRQAILAGERVQRPLLPAAQSTPGAYPKVAIAILQDVSNLIVRQSVVAGQAMGLAAVEVEQARPNRGHPDGAIAIGVDGPELAVAQAFFLEHDFKTIVPQPIQSILGRNPELARWIFTNGQTVLADQSLRCVVSDELPGLQPDQAGQCPKPQLTMAILEDLEHAIARKAIFHPIGFKPPFGIAAQPA